MRATKYIIGGLAVFAIVGWVAYAYFAPESSTHVEQPATSIMENGTPILRGYFAGADDFHYASGEVRVWQKPDGNHVLRFMDYDARDGPDVYLYLTKTAGASSTEQIEGESLRLLVSGGAGDGRATLRGDFNVDIPPGTDISQFRGLTIWCDQFNQYFGSAALTSF